MIYEPNINMVGFNFETYALLLNFPVIKSHVFDLLLRKTRAAS